MGGTYLRPIRSLNLGSMKEPDVIPRAEAEYIVGASPAAFLRFTERYGLRPLRIAQGEVYRRSEFTAAVERALVEAEQTDAV